MIDVLASEPAVFFLVVALVLSLLALWGGYAYAARAKAQNDDRDENAFGLGQTAIFGLIVLILAFSFSFAAERFEARRALVVQEADAVGAAYAHLDFLPLAQRSAAQTLMHDYAAARVGALSETTYAWNDGPSTSKARAIHERLWELASADVRADPYNVAYLSLAETIDKMGDITDFQTAAINNHVPAPILGIVILCTFVGAGLLGLTFGRVKSPNRALSLIFCVIFAATVFTIVDLDHPKGGLLKIDVAPMQNALDDMR
jgi:hypothetical protein